jgi:hypothetical protein
MVRGSSGSRGAPRRPFPASRSLFHSGRPPPLASRVHSLVRPVLFGVSSPSFLRRLSVRRRPAMGFRPSSRHHQECPRSRGVPTARCVPPTGFLNLPTACSTPGFAGLFHPAATSRVSVQGLGPDPQPRRLVAGRASLPLAACALTGCPAATRPRLSFEALIRGARRTSKSVVGLRRRPLPSSVSPPPGSVDRIAPQDHDRIGAPLLTFPPASSPLRCRSGAGSDGDLQRIGDAFAGGSSPSAPTCTRFLPADEPFTLGGCRSRRRGANAMSLRISSSEAYPKRLPKESIRALHLVQRFKPS